MKNRIIPLTTIIIMFLSITCHAATLAKVDMYWEHGLTTEAKSGLIDIIFSNAGNDVKAEAYYKLGVIAFEDKNISASLNTWKELVKKYPNSKQATLVKDRIKELAEIVGEVSKTSVENAIAQSYLRHADFWSKGKDEIFQVDSSWLLNVEAAVKWYDKVIREFPKTVASRLAYEKKMRTLIGWKEPGRYGESHGVQADFNRYMPELTQTFSTFEAEHPDASTLQAFRYLIAQEYWKHKDWDKTREWLKIIISKSETDTFYRDLAERRMKKVEY